MKKLLSVFCLAVLAGGLMLSSCTKKQFTIKAEVSPADAGSVTGAGVYDEGATCTLTAVAKDGYEFEKWQDGSTNKTITITVTADATYTAYFKEKEVEPQPEPEPQPQPQQDPVPPAVPTPSGNGIAVTFGTSTWQASAIDATHYNDYGAWDIYSCKTSFQEFPIADVCTYADAVGNYTDATTDGQHYGNVVNYIEYYEDTYLQDNSGNRYGDWWVKTATLNVTAFDATALTMSANLSAVMFDAEAAFADGVGFDNASKIGMSVGMVGVQMEEYAAGKATPMKKRTASKLFRVK